MALGNSYQRGNNNDKNTDPTIYCPIQFRNNEGVDPSSLSFSYWNKLLKISISPMIEPKPGDAYVSYDHKNNIYIHINYMKAKILHDEITEFLKDTSKLNSIGINSGANGLLTISNGKEFGINSPVLVIRKMDENGGILSSYAYQFNNASYYNSIRNFDEKSLKYDTIDCPNAELLVMQEILRTYYESSTYATAYTVVDTSNYGSSRIQGKLDQLLENAGIETGGNKRGGGGGGKSFFNRGSGGGSNDPVSSASRSQTTIDDLSSELG